MSSEAKNSMSTTIGPIKDDLLFAIVSGVDHLLQT